MSKKEKTTPNYNFSQGFLKQLADSTLLLIDRDIEQFTDRGFTPEKKSKFEDLIEDFASYITDEQLSAMVSGATAAREKERKSLERQMRTIFLSAKNVFTENSSIYREFGNADLTRQSDSELVRRAKILIPIVTKYQSDLESEGITKEKINMMAQTISTFDESIDLKTKAVSYRDICSENRIKLANNLYALIVKYCDTGKDIWIEESEARYNDYVIYNTKTGTSETEE